MRAAEARVAVVAVLGGADSGEDGVVVVVAGQEEGRQAGTSGAGTGGEITFVINARTGMVAGRAEEDGGVVGRVVAATAREEEGTVMGKEVGRRSGVGKEDGVVVVAMVVVVETEGARAMVVVVVAVAGVAATKSTMLTKVPTHRTPLTGSAHTVCGREWGLVWGVVLG